MQPFRNICGIAFRSSRCSLQKEALSLPQKAWKIHRAARRLFASEMRNHPDQE
jgi:hypothetical protein